MQENNSPKSTKPVDNGAVAGKADAGALKASTVASKAKVDGVKNEIAALVNKAEKDSSSSKLNIVTRSDFVRKIGEKIKDSENILVALSRNPSVDEIAAAIALTIYLDGIQKHTTAIYSGKTPDTLAFLRPEDTFETNTASLQDFIIALNKEKADHLRYRLEGDFVKVYITPYKTMITEKDLEFMRGDFNVDLVLALNVPTAADLDEALSEHGRIMHDASAVDITVGAPGRFGEIEWSDPNESSVSEMVANLIFFLQPNDMPLEKDVATALLTGIVAATDRFSNAQTTSETLQLASKLMSMGADQQLISSHVITNDATVPEEEKKLDMTVPEDDSSLTVGHEPGVNAEVSVPAAPSVTEPVSPVVVPEVNNAGVASQGVGAQNTAPEAPGVPVVPTAPAGLEVSVAPVVSETPAVPEGPKDYGQMMADALAEADAQAAAQQAAMQAQMQQQQAMQMGVPNVEQPGISTPVMPEMAQAMPMPEVPQEVAPEAVEGGASYIVGNDAPTEPVVEMPPAGVPGNVELPAADGLAQPAGSTGMPGMPMEPVQAPVIDAQMVPEGQPVMQEGEVVLPPAPEPPVPGAAMPGAENSEMKMATGPELVPPVLPEVQVPVDLPTEPIDNPGAYRIPGM